MQEEKHRKHKIYRELEQLTSEMNFTIDAALVEGPHDKKTLSLLGYRKAILVCSRLAHHVLADLIPKQVSRVVILTDFDEQGMILYKQFFSLLERTGVTVDLFYRCQFQKLLKSARISTIEGIYNLKLHLFPLHT